jgi:hypothetical protein
MRKALVFLVAVVFMFNVYGCAALVVGAISGAGTAVWLQGKISQDLNVSRDRAEEATKSALRSMNMGIDKETISRDVTQIMSEYSDGSTVWIDIRPINANKSQIEVRVGATGNKDASLKIVDEIKSRL